MPNHHRSPNDSLADMQLASPSPFSGQMVADCAFSCTKLTSQPPSKCTWTFARSFAELSRKYPYPQTPAISRRHIRGKTNTRGLGAWLLQSLTFGSLAAAFGACFLETSERNIRQYQRQVQGCASWPWRLAVAKPHFWKLWREGKCPEYIATQWTEPETKPTTLLLPDPRAAGGGSPLQDIQWLIISNFRETFANKTITFANSKKSFARVPNITWTVFAIKTLYKDLQIDHHMVTYKQTCFYVRKLYCRIKAKR